MLLRVSVPGKPTVLKDLGPGVGRWHNYEVMAKTIDDLPKSTARQLGDRRR